MHECPDCGQVCCCDQDDTWNDAASDECEHECTEYDDDDDGEDDDYRPDERWE
jgi:hypothetical protein